MEEPEADRRLADAFDIIETVADTEDVIVQLRDFLRVDHLVYHSSRLGSSPSADPYIRLTYPASWIKRYLQMNYVEVDPVLREGFQRTLPFDWSEIAITRQEEMALMIDALAHGVGPHGMSIPLVSKRGHRGLFSISFAGTPEAWAVFKEQNRDLSIQIANRIHRRVIRDVFGEEHIHLSAREVEVLHWKALGKDATEIATILDISPHTVRDYIKSARFKLDCVTSAQAVSKAVKLGLLAI
jgi:DNA-binding CsgD family transcriptional regulator